MGKKTLRFFVALLVVKQSKGDNISLIAGFVEFGESAESAVKREVLEEVGLNIKNIVYYKSQPWGLSESILLGFFAEVENNLEIDMDRSELAEAYWIKRDDISIPNEKLTLTIEMISAYKKNMYTGDVYG